MLERTCILLTNIPTPYRVHFFKRVSEAFAQAGWTFEVWFMARSERGRFWTFADDDFTFPHKFLPGTSFVIRNTTFHLNLSVLSLIRRQRPAIVICAGAWTLPTVWLALIARACPIWFWSESHFMSSQSPTGMIEAMRRLILRRFDGFFVPGILARDYVASRVHGRPIVQLPNTVEEDALNWSDAERQQSRKSIRQTLEIPDGSRMLLLSAHLTARKGVLEFLRGFAELSQHEQNQIVVVVVGDGPERNALERQASSSSANRVHFVGHHTFDQARRFYAAADGFLLPSLADPNPLVVVEALWAGLPLLLSNRVGNHPEALLEGANGWLFDPVEPQSVANALRSWLNAPADTLLRFGAESRQLAVSAFRSDAAAQHMTSIALENVSAA